MLQRICNVGIHCWAALCCALFLRNSLRDFLKPFISYANTLFIFEYIHFAKFHKVLSSFRQFHKVSLNFTKLHYNKFQDVLSCITCFKQILPIFIICHDVSPSFTWLYQVSVNFTKFRYILLSHKFAISFTKCCRA